MSSLEIASHRVIRRESRHSRSGRKKAIFLATLRGVSLMDELAVAAADVFHTRVGEI